MKTTKRIAKRAGKTSVKIQKGAAKTRKVTGAPTCACGCGSVLESKGAIRKAIRGLAAFQRGHDHALVCRLIKECGGVMGLMAKVRAGDRGTK